MFAIPRRWIYLGVLATSAFAAGQGCFGPSEPVATCPDEDPSASVDVAGVFRYFGERPLMLSGTITFEQEGNLVRVIDTTYDFSGDRRLMGEAVLQGNRLTIQLVPRNGDTDYRADVTFLFNKDGDEFCVEFSDTNGDTGGMGSYRGYRTSP